MFRFLEALRNASIPARERAAFVAALAVTIGIGAIWFSLIFGFRTEQSIERIAKNAPEPATTSANAIEGPFARLRASAADAAVSIAAQVGTITNLWKSYLFPPPLQFERQDTSEVTLFSDAPDAKESTKPSE